MERTTAFAAIAAFNENHGGFVKRLVETLGANGAEKYAKDRHLDGLVREIRLANHKPNHFSAAH